MTGKRKKQLSMKSKITVVGAYSCSVIAGTLLVSDVVWTTSQTGSPFVIAYDFGGIAALVNLFIYLGLAGIVLAGIILGVSWTKYPFHDDQSNKE